MNVTDAEALPAVAVPIVGAVEGPLVEPCAPRIGMCLFYPNLVERDLATRQQLPA